MRRHLLTDDALASINRAVAAAKTPMGAYCVGIVSALAWNLDKVPPENVLEAAAQCVDLKGAIDWYMFTNVLRKASLVA